MLKYTFNPDKEKAFLKFWQLKQLSQFEKLKKDNQKIFGYLCSLKDECKRELSTLLNKFIELEIIKVREGSFEVDKNNKSITAKDFSVTDELKFFDDINLITIQRDRSNLSQGYDIVFLTDFFVSFMESSYYLPDTTVPVPQKIKIESFSKPEQKIILHVKGSYYYYKGIELDIYNTLSKKGILLGGFDGSMVPCVHSPEDIEKESYEGNQAAMQYNANEAPALFMYTLERRMFEEKKLKRGVVQNPCDVFKMHNDTYETLQTLLSKPKRFRQFRKLSFFGKWRYVLKKTDKELFAFISVFQELLCSTTAIHIDDFNRKINKYITENRDTTNVFESPISTIIKKMITYGFIKKDKNFLFVSQKFTESILSDNISKWVRSGVIFTSLPKGI